MKPLQQSTNFLHGGGEMGELTRQYDWASTSIGEPAQWPLSLKTTLGVVLHSAFPMFLFWGDELICFYNDAFRPSLGNEGKHPAIGKHGKEVWAEIWDFIGPMINGVKETGIPVYYENQLVPFYRNGRIEDIYWTFSYSPAYGDDGHINGVFVTCSETTQAVQNLQKVEESEERFRVMAENSNILIAMSNETKNAIYFNKAWTDLTGREMEDLLAFGWADLIHEEDRDEFVNIYLDAFDKQQPFTGEFRILNKEGNYTWLLAKGLQRFLSDGSFAGYISSCVDITDRKQVEKAFSETEQRLRTLVENAPFPIGVYIGREMQVALANEAIIKVWGKGPDVIGKKFGDVLPELDNQEVLKQLDQVFVTGVPFHIRHQHLDLEVDGKLQPFYFNYSLTPLFDEAGKVYGVMNTGADVTDLNLAKQKVEQSERNFRSMILQAPVAMCILLGPEHIIEVANKMMIELWGKPAGDVLHKPVFEALPDARAQGLEQLLSSVYNTGVAFSANEHPVELVRNGVLETVYQNFVYEPYRSADGSILGVLAISVDVTAQVIARQKIEEIVAERTQELATANAELQRSNEELAQFAYIASHDLQEPVRKIGTFSQMLEQSLTHIEEKPKKYIEKINDATSRMTLLIRDVLAYSELSKQNDVFVSQVNLQQIAANTQTDFELLIEQTGAKVSFANLPTIEAIPLQMTQLFGNLLSNSLKFIKAGTPPEITVTATVLSEEEAASFGIELSGNLYYNITFRDNGIGIAPEDAERIFNIFQRLHGKMEYAGTGIGLALCKKIAQNHHGCISAAASSREGAVFNIVLPAKQA